MKIIVFFVFFSISSFGFSQTYLEKNINLGGVTYSLPNGFTISRNEESIYPVEISEKNTLPSLSDNYGVVLAKPETYVNSLFGKVAAIFESKKEDYCIFVQFSNYTKGVEKKGVVVRNKEFSEEEKYYLEHLPFDGIKRDFRYGRFFQGANEKEAYELLQMLKLLPKEEAKKMFNADIMFSYPVDLHGNNYKEKYTRAKAFVIQGKRSVIYLYFLMTNDNYWKADTFLKDFEKVFWFNE